MRTVFFRMMNGGRWAALACVIALLAGCAGSRAPAASEGAAAGAAAPAFVRDVAPFTVRDAAGQAFDFPFLGGLEVPRPQFVDIDGDADPDLFVQEYTGRVTFFENTGTPDSAAFTWRTDQYAGLDVGEWYRFTDLDEDGDFDLLAEQPYSYIRYFRNEGTPERARFVAAADTLLDVDGEPIFSDRQNIPNVTDIDCDGRADLLIGRLDGTITRYEEDPAAAATGVPRFQLVTERFEDIEIVSQVAQPGGAPLPMPGDPGGPSASAAAETAGKRHGANTMTFADVDGDGDVDLLWGDFFEPSLLLIRNTGSCQTPVLRGRPVPFPPESPVLTSGYNAPTVTDIDADGDLDVFMGVLGGAFDPSRTARDNFYFFEQTPDGYPLRTRRFLQGIDVGSDSVPALGDLDGDGDVDLLLANKISAHDPQTGQVFVFENRRDEEGAGLVLADSLSLPPAYHFAPTLGDLDADGDADLLVGTWNDGVGFYRNEGGAFTAVDPRLVQLTRGSHTAPALGDLDGDGDLDLIVGETSGTLNYYRNEGTPQAPAFTLVSDTYLDADVGRRSAPALRDLDGDGDLDLVVGTEDDGLVVFRNEGTPQAPAFVPAEAGLLPKAVPPLTAPAFGDLDGDGAADLVLGGRGGGLLFYAYR